MQAKDKPWKKGKGAKDAPADVDEIDKLAQTAEEFDKDLGVAPDVDQIDSVAQTAEEFDRDLDPRTAMLRDLKANQTPYIADYHRTRDVAEQTPHQRAYNQLAARNTPENPNRVSKELDSAFKFYVQSWTSFNDPLRAGQSVDEIRQDNPFVGDSIQRMDEYMEGEGKLSDDLTTYRGIDDKFLKFLFSQAGIKEKKYLDKKGEIDHDKIAKHKLLEQLVGTTFEDKAYVSTTTNPAFANMWTMRDKLKARQEQVGYDPNQFGKDVQEQVDLAMLNDTSLMKGSHIMNMHYKAGTKGAFISTPVSTQSEFMLDRGQSYRINGASRRADGSYAFDVDVLGALEEEAKKGKKK
jgi:hypothetical protein